MFSNNPGVNNSLQGGLAKKFSEVYNCVNQLIITLYGIYDNELLIPDFRVQQERQITINMRKSSIIVCGIIIYIGEIILLLVLLSAVGSFFPKAVVSFPPTSSDYALISVIFIIRAIAIAVAIGLLRREIIHAKRDWANPEDIWFLKR